MSDTTKNTADAAAGTEGTDEGQAPDTASTDTGTDTGDTTNEGTDEGADEGADEESDDTLPEWARTKLTKANSEAASYRTQLREVQASLANAKTPEEFEAATNELNTKIEALETQLLRSTVARKFNLPDDLADRLRGGTEEELEADAKALQKYAAPAGDPDLSGGLDPSEESEEFDAVAEARKARQRRY